MRAAVGAAATAALAVVALPVLVLVVVTSGLTAGSPTGAAAATPPGQAGDTAAAWAVGELGKPYRWGAAGPGAFDCSGLVLRAWEAAGVVLPRVAVDQYGAGPHVPATGARPGDLVFFAIDAADPATIVHVGISLGSGLMVDAPFTGAVVRVDHVSGAGLVALATRPG